MNTKNLLLILKLKQISKYLAIEDLLELSFACRLVYNQLKYYLLHYFAIKNSQFYKYSENGKKFLEFENETNNYILKNSKIIKFLAIDIYHSSYNISLNFEVLINLTSVYFNSRIRLSGLNKLLSSSKYLVKLNLSEARVEDDLSSEINSSHIQLPSSLIELSINSLIWTPSTFNVYSISIHKEFGAYLFGNAITFPKLKSLTYYGYSPIPESFLNYLLSKSPNLTKFIGGGAVFNQTTYELFSTRCLLLTNLRLIFIYNIPVSMEALNNCKFDTRSNLLRLKSTVCDNTFHTYFICKSCPSLTELTLEWTLISMKNLNKLLSLLPQIKKLNLNSYTNEIDIKGLNFNNSSVISLSLNKIGKVSLVNLIKVLGGWTLLNHISISKSSNEISNRNLEEFKFGFKKSFWICYSYRNFYKIWKL
jgi:hypothetical protein